MTLQPCPIPDGYYVLSRRLHYYYSYYPNYQRFLFFISSFSCIYYGSINLHQTVCVQQCNPKCECVQHRVNSLSFSEIFQLDGQLQVCVYHKFCSEMFFLNLVFLSMSQKLTLFVKVHRQSPPSNLLHYLLSFHLLIVILF